MKIEVDFVDCNPRRWELQILDYVEETGTGDAGLFVEAENEEQAKKYLENLIKLIKENELNTEGGN